MSLMAALLAGMTAAVAMAITVNWREEAEAHTTEIHLDQTLFTRRTK